MTSPRSNALAGRPSHVPHALPPDAWCKTEGRSTVTHAAASDASPPAGDSGRGADSGQDTNPGRGEAPGRGTEPGRPHAERVWEQRRALGRRLAALRSRSGFSQWEFAPLTGYSRSTVSDAELGRHRLRREFWQRCDEALISEGVLTAAYDRIEVLATAVRQSARIQAQAVREEQASRRLQALLPASSSAGLGPAGLGPAGLVGLPPAGAVPPAPRVAPALGGPVLGGPVLGGRSCTGRSCTGRSCSSRFRCSGPCFPRGRGPPGHSRPAGGRSGPVTAGRDGAVPALPPAGRRDHRRCRAAGRQSGRLGTSYLACGVRLWRACVWCASAAAGGSISPSVKEPDSIWWRRMSASCLQTGHLSGALVSVSLCICNFISNFH